MAMRVPLIMYAFPVKDASLQKNATIKIPVRSTAAMLKLKNVLFRRVVTMVQTVLLILVTKKRALVRMNW